MFGMQDEFKVVRDGLSGTRPIDEDVMSSVAVLAERLKRLKKSNSIFAGISFSPQAEELACQEMMTTLC